MQHKQQLYRFALQDFILLYSPGLMKQISINNLSTDGNFHSRQNYLHLYVLTMPVYIFAT